MKLSLITVSYNSEETIESTFNSVKMQKKKGFDFEYILVDGGSTDRTMAISEEYKEILSLAVSEPDEGLYNAMNKGIKLASGDVIGFLNSDDTLHDESTLADIMTLFQRIQEASVVFGNLNYVDSRGNITRRWRTGEQKSFASGWHPAHPAFYANKRLFDVHGGFDENLSIAADFDLMLRFLDVANARASYLDKVFVDMKLGGESNRSLRNIRLGNEQIIRSFRKYSIQPQIFYTYRRWVRKIFQSIK